MTKADSFDPLLLSQVRLAVVSVLVERGAATFPDLKELLGVTQGNLGLHLRKLEDGGYVAIEKEFVGRKPRTTVRLTPAGRRALREHVDHLARIAGRA